MKGDREARLHALRSLAFSGAPPLVWFTPRWLGAATRLVRRAGSVPSSFRWPARPRPKASHRCDRSARESGCDRLMHAMKQSPLRGVSSHSVGAADVAAVLAAVADLAAVAETDLLLKRAVEAARDEIGVERITLYLCDGGSARVSLRGTWGLDAQGSVIEARALHYEYDRAGHAALLRLHAEGHLWKHHLKASDGGRGLARRIGQGGLVVTPLIAGGELIGVMHNGSTPQRPLDARKQAQVAVYCSVLATLIVARRAHRRWAPAQDVAYGPVVCGAMTALIENPATRGSMLARHLDVSAGHLARSFKLEVGISLVEYRQRLLLDRFFDSLADGQATLVSAARQAGFRSYTQFYRVYRKLVGSAPRDGLVVAPRRD
jgi:methylphosphotriester-DNA--protein-cysteine methyltransferase